MRIRKDWFSWWVLWATLIVTGRGPLEAELWEKEDLSSAYYVESAAHWGSTLASADFDGDGYMDLAVAAPDWDYDIVTDAGLLHVYHGGPGGFTLRFVEPFYNGGLSGGHMGVALAAVDFGGIGHRNWLAVGVPGATYPTLAGTHDEAGAVLIYEYDAGGWSLRHTWRQGFDFVLGGHSPGAHFGATLVVGRFGNDEYEDLAVGAPDAGVYAPASETIVPGAGSVNLFYGGVGGPSRFNGYLHEGNMAPAGLQAYAHFGSALAAGDFDGDGRGDLAIGVPDADFGAKTNLVRNAGRVRIRYANNETAILDDVDLGNTREENDRFGAAVAAADFDRWFGCVTLACYDDLAIGVPGEGSGAGRVAVVEGTASGLDPAFRSNFYQHHADSGFSTPEAGDGFGSVLLGAEIDRKWGADLLVGAPGEDWGSVANQGVAHILFGGGSGLLSHPTRSLVLLSPSSSTPGEAGDRFGASFAAGDFFGTGTTDLAIGIPGRTVTPDLPPWETQPGPQSDAGLVKVFLGALFADGFETGTTANWE